MSTSVAVTCQFCDKSFKRRSNCTRHTKSVHKRNLNGTPVLDQPRERFTCGCCGKVFTAKPNLQRHINVVHSVNVTKYNCSECKFETVHETNLKRHILKTHKNKKEISEICSDQYFKCLLCDSKYKDEKNLKQHQRRKHNICVLIPTKRKCPICPYISKQKKMSEIYSHFEKEHGVPIRREHYNFDSAEEFYSWKNGVEKETKTLYVKKTSTDSVAYYQCHRCGYHRSKGHLKRRMKLSGSCKINGFCPAGITIKFKNNKVQVGFISTHVGHSNDPKYLRLTKEEKKTITLLLKSKKPQEDSLKFIGGSISNFDIRGLYLANKKDIASEENSFNLHDESLNHPFDPISVDSWVEEFSNSENVALVRYKPQGTEDPEFPDLKADDFLLLLMTETQKNMLKKYGCDTICIDSTHGLNSYDFQLFTVLVLDDTREGFPTAFMFTNRGDDCVISLFYKAIKSITGCITPKVFMSDMEETFYFTWRKCMGVPEHRIFCAWHVLKEWRTNIIRKIKIKETREFVDNTLKTLLYEPDVESFNTLLSKALKVMDEDPELIAFAEYFQNYYVNNEGFKSWAYCYRVNAGINTNMSLENFNRVLKYCYLKGKQICPLENTLCAVLNLLRNKLFNLLIKLQRWKLIGKLLVLRNNHKQCLSFQPDQIIKSEGKWQVLSLAEAEYYTVKKIKECKSCQLRCLHCDSCFHEYVCSCTDNAVRNNMCQHIHAVAKSEIQNDSNFNKKTDSSNDSVMVYDREIGDDQVAEVILTHTPENNDENESLETLKSNINQLCQTLISNVRSAEQGTFVCNELKKIKTTLEALNLPDCHQSTNV